MRKDDDKIGMGFFDFRLELFPRIHRRQNFHFLYALKRLLIHQPNDCNLERPLMKNMQPLENKTAFHIGKIASHENRAGNGLQLF